MRPHCTSACSATMIDLMPCHWLGSNPYYVCEQVVYDHRTTATDEKNMEKVFKNVRETILNSNMAALDDL